MDDVTLLAACACAALAFLVYLMWRAATAQSWGDFAATEKKKWRMDEEKRKDGAKKRKRHRSRAKAAPG